MKYSQFCPIAKATEVLGDRWTLLIVREALMGASRFSEFQRGLGGISTAVLTERLKSMAENGLLVRRSLTGKRGYEYFPTPGCKELLPIIVSLGDWGMRWAKDNLVEEDYDVELLMLYLERSIIREMLPGPGQDVDVYFNSTVRTMTDVWLGHRTYRDAIKADELTIVGDQALTKSVNRWLACTLFSPPSANSPIN